MSDASAPLLRMSGIDKAYSGIPALRAASLEVGAGEVHALVGQNGAGKSTMIKILTGAVRRDAGAISFASRAIAFATPQEAQRGGISTIYQEINLVPTRSVAENIFLGREPRRFGFVDWPRMHREAAGLLRRFRIEIDVRAPLSRYTIAIQQMVAIARALSFEARLVIMDEPTSSLDETEVAVLFDVIRQLKAEGVSVVFVTHKLDELYAICDRVTIMRDGLTVAVSAMAAMSKLALVAAMLGRNLADVERQGATGFRHVGHAARDGVIEATGLRVGRRVHDVSLSVRAGEIVGLAGLLGSGRSETARALFGADAAEAGTIRYASVPVVMTAPGQAIGLGMGFCAEDRKVDGIIPEMSVRENLTLALLPRLTRAGVVDTTQQAEIVAKFIRRLGIKTAGPEQRIRELSGGNQQKVLLARWLCMNPKLLILDEPTRGIDVGAKAEIQALIEELAGEGLGVLMISSELDELIEGCDRVTVLRDGRTVVELSGADKTGEAVMHAMAHGASAIEATAVSEIAQPAIAVRPRRDWPRLAQNFGALAALAVLLAFNVAVTRNFVSWQTLNVNLTQVCNIVIVGTGMTLVIATGGIDLSVGSLMAISGALAPLIFGGHILPMPSQLIGTVLAFVIPVLVVGLLGLLNGWFITRFRIQPIIATLVLFIAGRGIAQVLTNGNLQTFSRPDFQYIGLGRPFGVPFQVILMVAFVALAAWTLARTLFGRYVLAVGGNEAAARLAGVPVRRVKRAVYAISGLLAGVAGLVVISINSSADANLVGLGMELDAIAAVAVGGTPLTGGRASILGTLVGALIIQLVRYTLLANGVPDGAALIVKAAIILVAVYLQRQARA